MRIHYLGLAAAAGLVLQGCSYQRPMEVTQQMARTEAVLQQAESAGTQELALAELQLARNKLADARAAYDKESEDGDREAMRLARQAEVDVQFAVAKAQAERQRAATREVQQGVETLRDEARRNTGTSGPARIN